MTPELIEKVGSAALNNCFEGNTEFVTDTGLKKLKDLSGTYCNVLTQNGKYNKAQVQSFGKQSLYEITLKPFGIRSNLELKYKVTKNHKWFLKDGSITTDLRLNDVVSSKFYEQEIDETSTDFIEGFSHGLIFGDGTRHTYYPNRHHIKVCDGQQDIYRPILSAHKGFKSETVGKDKYPVFTIISDENLKELPSVDKTHIYLNGFIKGWMQADSHSHVKSQTYCLDTQNKEAADWVIKNAVYANMSVTGVNIENRDTNFGKRKNPLNRISLSPKECFYRVDKIEYVNDEEVYCVTEPITSSFVLSSGILTGNCGYCSTMNIDKSSEEATKPFTFLMDMSMLGVGIGFDVKGAGKITINMEALISKSTFTFIVPDTREGWVESVKELLLFYFDTNTPYTDIQFDYSLVRLFGEPIKTFGGVASGHKPLEELHNNIKNVLNPLRGKLLTETAIVDIMNMIGVCVVSGNVRRTAEIAFGSSEEFMDLKNYEKNPQRMNYGWTSNNTIFAERGQDYSEVSKRIMLNGEPGLAWLKNMQNYGRMCEAPNYKDIKALGGNPCLEQTLESYELCCLVETFPTNHDSIEDYLETLKYAYLYAKTVTLVPTHNEDTNEVMLRNRRIGLSQSGVAMYIDKFGIEKHKQLCMRGYETIQYYDGIYSDWFKIPKSIKTTSIKPSGTVSLLAGVTPGMHYPESNYYIRRIRIGKHSNLIDSIQKSGYKIEDDSYDKSSYVVEIPINIEGVRQLDDVSMWEQVALASYLQEYWADNQVSCTVTFRPNEAKDIASTLNYFQYKLKGISFLPKTESGAYVQMPYEAITKEQFEEMNKNIKPIDFNNLSQDSVMEKYCDSDSCTI